MSDSESNPLRSLLSGIDLGPSWARSDASSSPKPRPPRDETQDASARSDKRDRQDRGRREDRRDDRRGERDGGRRFDSRRGDRNDRRPGPPQREEITPPSGVRVQIHPDPQAVHLIGKEIHQFARVYSLYDVAQTLLSQRERVRAVYEVDAAKPALYQGLLSESLWLTREEAIRHFWQSPAKDQLFEEEIIEVDPPAGNFQVVARCGMSGEWLGPPNFHAYQTNLRRIHRERFSNLPFEVFTSRVRSERGEEAVNAWLETMKKRTRWRLKGSEDAPWIEDISEAERIFSTQHFASAFKETRHAEISGAIDAKSISPALLLILKFAGSNARKHPAILIPAVCRHLESEHLPVFKREGKLFTGPARPHPVPADAVLAERPASMVAWLREHPGSKLADLWNAVLPEGTEEAPPEWKADLLWLLGQGHLLLFSDDRLVLPERRSTAPITAVAAEATVTPAKAAEKKKRKRKPKKRKPRKRRGITTRKLKLTPMILREAKSTEGHPWRHALQNRTLRRARVLAAREESED